MLQLSYTCTALSHQQAEMALLSWHRLLMPSSLENNPELSKPAWFKLLEMQPTSQYVTEWDTWNVESFILVALIKFFIFFMFFTNV